MFDWRINRDLMATIPIIELNCRKSRNLSVTKETLPITYFNVRMCKTGHKVSYFNWLSSIYFIYYVNKVFNK